MNYNYVYDTKQISCLVTSKIYSLLEHRGWSLRTLSEESNIPYETLKKLLSGKIENTSMHNIIKIATALQCPIDYLVNENPLESVSFENSPHTNGIWDYFSNIHVSCKNNLPFHSDHYVPILQPHSIAQDFSPMEPALDFLDISHYPVDFRHKVQYGLVICSHIYHPIFYYNDILLLAKDRFPHNGEFAIFINQGNLYLRKFYSYSDSILLEPVNGMGSSITITSLSSWIFLGYVTGIHRNNPKLK